MWHAADIAEKIRHARDYQFIDVPEPKFNWETFKPQRDAYIRRLNGIYERNLEKDNVENHFGHARLISPNTVEVTRENNEKYTLKGKNICIAVGGRPTIPSDKDVPGASYGIDSDGFFDLESQPKRVAVAGAGYIAVELAGVLHTLGSEAHIFIRHEKVLRTFDPVIQDTLTDWMEHTGVNIHKKSNIKKVEKQSDGSLVLHTDKGETVTVDCLIWAIGRHANTEGIGLKEVGVKTDEKGNVVVDEYQNTNIKGVYSVGDVAGKFLLTPVAIAAGRRLSNRLFGPEKYKNDKLSYDNIPTVVFS